jgi:hypothetical protein
MEHRIKILDDSKIQSFLGALSRQYVFRSEGYDARKTAMGE